MKKLCVAWMMVAGAMAIGSPAWAQSDAEREGVDSLLQRLDDIEKRRRTAEPQGSGLEALAETGAASEGSGMPTSLAVWALGVALTIFGVAFVVRSYRGAEPSGEEGKALEVEETLWLGRGQRILLLRVRGQQMLVGATGGQLSSLGMVPVATPPVVAATDDGLNAVNGPKSSRRSEAERFAHLVQEELTNAAAGAPLRNKQQILRRLNSL